VGAILALVSATGTASRKVWLDDMAPDNEGPSPVTGDTDRRAASADEGDTRSASEPSETRAEHAFGAARHAVEKAEQELEPAWRRVTVGEPRLPVTLVVLAAISIELLLADRVANRPRWLLAGLAAALLVGIIVANPKRIDRPSRQLRVASLILIAVLSVANVASATRLVIDLINAQGIRDPAQLLLTGGAIWLTNVIVFSLWYWEFDRGGPAARAHGTHRYPDLLFPQMTSPELAAPGWEPNFFDYLYTSFTNATAFSPTDVMPMSRWTKFIMMTQSAISLTVVVLVIARAVNILK